MSAIASRQRTAKFNILAGKQVRVTKPARLSKLAVLKEHDLRKFLLVKGVEKKLQTVKELVVAEALLRVKQQAAKVPTVPKLVLSDVVAVEVHVGAQKAAVTAQKIHIDSLPITFAGVAQQRSFGAEVGLPPLPPPPHEAPQCFTTIAGTEPFSFDTGAFSADSGRIGVRPSCERIIGADASARLNIGNGNGGEGNNALACSTAVVDVGQQRFVGAFGEEMMRTVETMTTCTTEEGTGKQCFAAGNAARAARAAAAADAAIEDLTAQRVLRGPGDPLDLLGADAASLSSSQSSVSQQQQQTTEATSESWHHWQTSATSDEQGKYCVKPGSKRDYKDKKEAEQVLLFGLAVADALNALLATSHMLAGLALHSLVAAASSSLQEAAASESGEARRRSRQRCVPREEVVEQESRPRADILAC